MTPEADLGQPLTIITKSSTLDVAAVLDPPLDSMFLNKPLLLNDFLDYI